jgi:hypothetical protein
MPAFWCAALTTQSEGVRASAELPLLLVQVRAVRSTTGLALLADKNTSPWYFRYSAN